MTNWKKYKLGGIITLKRGYDLPTQDRKYGSVPIFSSAGHSGYHNVSMAKGPGVITGRYGTLGELFYTEDDYWPHNTTLYVKDFKSNYPKFIFYFLQTLKLDSQNDKTSVPGLNRNHLHEIDVSIPELKTQKQIASILSSLDNKIELNRRMNQTLEQIAATLFKKYFVDDINPNNLPEGWRLGKIGEILEVRGGTTPSTSNQEFWNGSFNWTSPKDLSSLRVPVLLNTEKKITEAGLKKVGSGLLPIGTLLLSSRAPIGYLAITQIPVAINQGYIAIVCDKGYSNLFMLNWLKENMNIIIQNSNGSTFLEISKSVFRNINIAVPPTSKVKNFDKIANPLFERVVSNEKEIIHLSKIRDILLPKLMSGEIDVSTTPQNESLHAEVFS